MSDSEFKTLNLQLFCLGFFKVWIEQLWPDLLEHQEIGTPQTLQKFSLRFKGL